MAYPLTIIALLFSLQASGQGLHKKLKMLELSYKQAQIFLKQEVTEGRPISREKWEQLLVKDGIQFTGAERSKLNAYHKTLIKTAKANAERLSVISLNEIRRKKVVRQFCESLPKGGGLHLHPSGMVYEEPLRILLNQANPKLSREIVASAIDPSLGELYPGELGFLGSGEKFYNDLKQEEKDAFVKLFFLPEGSHGFRRFAAIFGLFKFLKSQGVDEKKVYYRYFTEQAKKQGLIYQELSKSMDTDEKTMAYYNEMAKWLEAETGVATRFIISYGRWMPFAHSLNKTKQVLRLGLPSHLVGVNLVGHELGTSLLEQGQAIYGLLKNENDSIYLTVHAGEEGDLRNLRDALIMGVNRIGHGVLLAEDPVHLELARIRKVPIETSVLSNQKVRVIDDVSRHPFLDFLRLGLKVSLSTDDEGIFKTDINKECLAVVRSTDIQWSELKRMIQNSIETAFLSSREKKPLIEKLNAQLVKFENQWQ